MYKEINSHFVGISENIGYAMTFKILLDDSKESVCRSIVHSALDPDLMKLCVEPNTSTDDIKVT